MRLYRLTGDSPVALAVTWVPPGPDVGVTLVDPTMVVHAHASEAPASGRAAPAAINPDQRASVRFLILIAIANLLQLRAPSCRAEARTVPRPTAGVKQVVLTTYYWGQGCAWSQRCSKASAMIVA